MDTLIVVIIGFYLFFESFTAINEMPKAKLRTFYKEFKNPYTVKYTVCGLYGLVLLLYAKEIEGFTALVVSLPVYFVIGRTLYRIKHYRELHHDHMG